MKKVEYVLLAMGVFFVALLVVTILGLVLDTALKIRSTYEDVQEIKIIMRNVPLIQIERPSIDPEAREL